jgi:hypothetical protein
MPLEMPISLGIPIFFEISISFDTPLQILCSLLFAVQIFDLLRPTKKLCSLYLLATEQCHCKQCAN